MPVFRIVRFAVRPDARVEVERLPGVLLVPAAAVFQRGTAAISYVATGSTFAPHTVIVLRRGRDQVAIADGLREGDRVATRDPAIEGAAAR